jgi:Fe-S cluster assembly ATP-binding protein
MSILEIKNANVSVETPQGDLGILKNVSLEFEPGKIYVVTGPNGSGKSTLAKYIMGIIPSNEGTIILDGEDISDADIVGRSQRGIGFAFQTPAKFKGLTVGRLLELARGDGKKNIGQTLRKVGLCPQDYIDRNIDGTFSGGELKRIEIASILVRDLKVAVFDEPEAGIDLWSFKRMTRTFLELNSETNTTLIIISHQERIMALADEVIVIEKGEVKEVTTNNHFLQNLQFDCDLTCECEGRKKDAR